MNLLETILLHKRQEVAARKKEYSVERLRDLPMFARRTLSLKRALSAKRMAVIAEIKKASPSRGVLREPFDPDMIAREYVEGGASALSVLTDERFFQGSLEVLASVRKLVHLPLLRKDFILDPYQLTEAKAYGADAVLLIAAALDPARLFELQAEAGSLGLECLVEVHTSEEIASLDQSGCDLIGINNRNLATFATDLSLSLHLRSYIRKDVTVVSESGISTADDLRRLIAGGIHAVLIGEAFMRQERPGEEVARLLRAVEGAEA
ncbi:MAG: Indole-3-glycerol-phosphate synthase [Bacteroidetes bacterium]|nr:Indole-3-glycerol-phosphate synthase [Bacteroidota bacterium]